MARILLSVGAILFALTGLVRAEERGETGAGVLKQVLDNDRIRVFQANFKPGDKIGMRSYPSHLLYMLTDGTLVFAPEGRIAYEVNFKAGDAMWFPPLVRGTENDSDQEVRVLLVELKDGRARSAEGKAPKGKGKARTRGRGGGKPKGGKK